MADSADGVFTIPENAQLYVMEASNTKITADSILNNAVIQLAITVSNELEAISTAEIDTVSEMINGTYDGWMGDSPGFPDDDDDSDDDSNDISITSTLVNEAQSVFGAQTSTAQSSLSNLTGTCENGPAAHNSSGKLYVESGEYDGLRRNTAPTITIKTKKIIGLICQQLVKNKSITI